MVLILVTVMVKFRSAAVLCRAKLCYPSGWKHGSHYQ
jgi:hypothetical protein